MSKAAVLVLPLALLSAAHAADNTVLIQHPLAKVTAAELEEAIDYIVPERQRPNMREKDRNMRGFLADYFTLKIMAAAAREHKLDQKKDVQLNRQFVENRLFTEALIEDFIARQPEPDYEAMAREAYLAAPERFQLPERVRAQHILIAVNDERGDKEAQKLAAEAYARVKKNLGAFAEIAKELSDDPSAQDNGGDLDYFTRETMVKPFSDKAFSMKPGQLSKPVKTQFGYHIIQVLDKKAGETQPFAEVRQQLMAEQAKAFRDAKRDEVVSQYRGSPEIKVNEEAMVEFVKKMQERAAREQ